MVRHSLSIIMFNATIQLVKTTVRAVADSSRTALRLTGPPKVGPTTKQVGVLLTLATKVATETATGSVRAARQAWRSTAPPDPLVYVNKARQIVRTPLYRKIVAEMRALKLRREHNILWRNRFVFPNPHVTAVVKRPTILSAVKSALMRRIIAAIRVIRTYTFKAVAFVGTCLSVAVSSFVEGPAVIARGFVRRIWDAIVRFYQRLIARFRRVKIKGVSRWTKFCRWIRPWYVQLYIPYRWFKHGLTYRTVYYGKVLGRNARTADLWWLALAAELAWL